MMHRWQMSVWKDVPDRMSPGNRKLKQGDTALHLVKWPKSGPLTTPNADEDVEQQELPFTVGKVQNGTATLEDSLAVSHRTKHSLNIGSSNCAPWHLPKFGENLCPHKTCTQMYSSVIHNCPNLEASKMSFNKWMDKQTVTHPYNGMLSDKMKSTCEEHKWLHLKANPPSSRPSPRWALKYRALGWSEDTHYFFLLGKEPSVFLLPHPGTQAS